MGQRGLAVFRAGQSGTKVASFMFLEWNSFPTERTVRVDACHATNGQPLRPSRGHGYAWHKQLGERSLSLLLLVPAVPLILAAVLLVKLSSRGPVFYLQRRVGLSGQTYTLYKIRTMFHDCERFTGPCWAAVQDPRVTAVGRWLRRLHVDELPQLWNIVRGEMSLVGPRPERPEIAEHLERLIPGYRERLILRPGLTGLAQVQLPPDCGLASVRTKLAHDLFYVQNLSLSLDLRILLGTGCYLLGIPFSFSNRFLKLPGGERVEQAYQGAIAHGRVDWKMQAT
jgi:lipopolysaccharide/colanic/teichoic acid biosynthesis glycosyltransferase